MHILSKKLSRTIFSVIFFSFFLTFFACSQLESASQNSTGSITFKLNTARTAIPEDAEAFIDIELKGGYEASKNRQPFSNEKTTSVSFSNVPVGAEVFVYAQVYVMYEDQKAVLYSGESETKTIKAGDNPFEFKLSLAYNSVIETSNTYIVLRPLFTKEHNNEKLYTNKLEFKYSEDEEKRDETFRWDFDGLGNYQRARVSYHGAQLKTTEDNVLAFKFVKTNTGAIYFQDQEPVTAESSAYEFDILQGIGINAIGIENKWDDREGVNNWSGDFSCYIDKIEFIKDSSLIDPDFNVVTKTDTSYTVKNPAIQTVIATKIYKNQIIFDSPRGENDNPYSAAYWEFEDLNQYSTATIKVKCTQQNETGMRFLVKGYSPFNYPEKTSSEDSKQVDNNIITLSEFNLTCTCVIALDDLKEDASGNPISLKAILFENASYYDNYDPMHFGEEWTIEIEEITLE